MDVSYSISSQEDNMDQDEEVLIMPEVNLSVRLFKYRWLILVLYSFTAFSNTLVWLSLFTVSDATCAFYKINSKTLLWSSSAFTFIQVFIAIPISFCPSQLGLRTTMVLAAAINAIGASIMIAGAHRNGFPFFAIGQTVIAIAASILPQLAPEVSAVWFGKNEHAISTSIGIIVGNSGAALGFLQPALLIKNVDAENHIDYIGEKLKELIYSQAALCILLLLLILAFFKDKPKQPPSLSQAIRHGPGRITFTGFKQHYKKLWKNKNYHLSGNSYALSSVLLVVVPISLNQIVSWRFPHHDASIGWMGFAGIVSGIVGSIFFGIVLDKTHEFKKLSLALSFVSLILWIGFTESLAQAHHLSLIFAIFVINLFVFVPVGPILVDMMSEMTYPIPESTSYVVPITVGRFYSIPVTFILGWLIEKRQFHISCLIIAGIIALCFVLIIVTKVELNRTMAGKSSEELETNDHKDEVEGVD